MAQAPCLLDRIICQRTPRRGHLSLSSPLNLLRATSQSKGRDSPQKGSNSPLLDMGRKLELRSLLSRRLRPRDRLFDKRLTEKGRGAPLPGPPVSEDQPAESSDLTRGSRLLTTGSGNQTAWSSRLTRRSSVAIHWLRHKARRSCVSAPRSGHKTSRSGRLTSRRDTNPAGQALQSAA